MAAFGGKADYLVQTGCRCSALLGCTWRGGDRSLFGPLKSGRFHALRIVIAHRTNRQRQEEIAVSQYFSHLLFDRFDSRQPLVAYVKDVFVRSTVKKELTILRFYGAGENRPVFLTIFGLTDKEQSEATSVQFCV